MDIHRPKAAHSWREFLIELGTIICGILIALGLEQVVSTLEWSRRVAETRDALDLELAENLGNAEIRVRLARCVEGQLDALAAVVDRAAASGSLPPLAAPTEPPYHSWGSGVWSSALSSQTASHLPADRLRGYSRFYQILERISAAEPREEETWTTLFGLAGPGRTFDAADARLFRQAIGEARHLNGLIAGFGVRLRQAVAVNRLSFDAHVFDERTRRTPGQACGPPTGRPPAAYGAAPATDFVDQALRHPAR